MPEYSLAYSQANYVLLTLTDQNLTAFNTLGLSATAGHLVRYQSADQLAHLSALVASYGDVFVLGGGSNVVLPPRLNSLIIKIEAMGIRLLEVTATHFIIEAEAGEPWHGFVDHCIDQGWYGLENLALIPGTVGAAPVQNIGAYGVEFDQRFHSLDAYNLRTGIEVRMSQQECDFSYRNSFFKQQPAGDWLILRVRFRLPRQWSPVLTYPDLQQHPVLGMAGDKISARHIFDAVCEIRRRKLPDPATLGNAGSFFKNPVVDVATYLAIKARWPGVVAYPQDHKQYKLAAGWLIDQAGWKGRRLGRVGVHEHQALVLVNYGGASAADIHALSQSIKADVLQRFGVLLEQEPVNVAG